ncbi:MAG: SBBP repeat-containing protein [Bacteroidia bacterium]
MKIKILLQLILLFSYPAYPQTFQWAVSISGVTSGPNVRSLTEDKYGYVYTTGEFHGTVDFDQGVGIFNLTSSGGGDLFIHKSDGAGNFIWAKQLAGDESNDIVTDDSGNVYITGEFSGGDDFDPGPAVVFLFSNGFNDIFIEKFDSAGNFIWVKQIGGTEYDLGRSISIDSFGHVFTTGTFSSTVDFDPDTGVYNLTSFPTFRDIFVHKMDVSGNFIWARGMGGYPNDYGHSITTDAAGNVFTTGVFSSDTVDFDPGPGIFNLVNLGSGWDIFIQKLDSAGNFLWAKGIGGIDMEDIYCIKTDISGNVYTTGVFQSDTVDFDPGLGVYNLIQVGVGSDIFVQKLDTAGNFVWAISIDGFGTIYNSFPTLTLDTAKNVYVSGNFSGTVDFDPGPGTFLMTSFGWPDVFIQKLDYAGNFIWAKQIGGTAAEGYSFSNECDNAGNLYTAGIFFGTIDFDPGAGTFNLTNPALQDVWIQKMSLASVGIEENLLALGLYISPNPFTTTITLKGTIQKGGVRIFDITGKEILRTKTFNEETKINTAHLTPGFYFINYREGERSVNKKIVKM